MKLKFKSDLAFQLDAIQAVIDLFEGLPPKQSQFEISFAPKADMLGFNELGVGNLLRLEQDQLLKNLHLVQERSNIPKSRLLIDPGDG